MDSLKRVMFIAPSAYPLGGVAVWLDYLAAALPEHGWEATVGLVSGRWHRIEHYRATYPNFPIRSIENRTGSVEGRIRALMKAILQVNPHVVVGVNIVDLWVACQRLRSQGCNFRAAMSIHGIADDLLGDMRREADWLDAVIVTNRLTGLLCTEYSGICPERVHYAPYGVNVNMLSALPRKSATAKLNIAWVGRLEQDQKRIDTISKILRHLDQFAVEYVLRIAGDGPDRATLLHDLAPWIASGRVEYLGALPPDRTGREVYALSDVLLLTSSWETGPIVVWEAMAAGVAIVSSRYVGSGLENALVHEENCLLFPIGDSRNAAAHLASLLDINLRNRLTLSGVSMVAQRYSVDISVSTWADCLHKIILLPQRPVCSPITQLEHSGRLDRTLGTHLAESLRRILGIRFEHSSPGGEWPHTKYSGGKEELLQKLAAELDIKIAD